jgi:hypothetical protein
LINNNCDATEVANSDKADSGSLWIATNSTVLVTCDDGYSGSGNVTCQPSGNLTTLPNCTVVACPALSAVANSDLTNDVTLVTDETQLVTCNNGYATSGDDTSFTVTCEGSGPGASSLSGATNSCNAVACPALAAVNNSDLSNETTLYTTDTVTVTCNDGYATSGDNTSFTVSCDASGAGESSLSGATNSSCEGKYVVPCVTWLCVLRRRMCLIAYSQGSIHLHL